MPERDLNTSSKVITSGLPRGRFKTLASLQERRWRVDDDLSPEETVFRALVGEVVDYAIFMLDEEGYIVSWNSGAERMKGYTAEEIRGKHFSIFYSREDIESHKPGNMLATATREGRVEDEGWRVRKNGTTFWANVVITAMHNQAGNVVGFSKVTRDLSERKALEQQIIRERNLLQSIIDHSPSMIFLKDREGRYLLVNNQFERQFGMPAASILGRTDSEIFSPLQAAKFAANDRLVLESGKAIEFDEQAIYTDGLHTSIVVKYPLKDADGNASALGGIVTDISERKKAQDAVRASEQILRDLVSALPVAVYVCNAEGIIEIYNRRAAELWGREPKCGDTSDKFCGSYRIFEVGGEFLPHAEGPMAQALRTGKPLSNQEIVVERPDGSRRRVMVNIVPRRNQQGDLTGAINCLTDVTELLMVKEKLNGVLEAAPDSIVVIDRQGKIQIVNSQTQRMFGYVREELNGKDIDILVPHLFHEENPDHRECYTPTPTTRTMRKGCDLVGVRKDGSAFAVDIGLSSFETEGGILVIAALRDITERKTAENELQESQKKLRALTARLESVREEEKSRLALELHDELGQILTVLKIDLSQISHELQPGNGPNSPAVEKELKSAFTHVDESIDAVRRIAFSLKSDLLNHFGLREAIRDYAKSFEARTRIKCSFISSVDSLPLRHDQCATVFRILQEALTNVARHSGAAKVRVSLRKSNRQVLLEIRDAGKGIPEGRINAPASFGIFGMQERARLLGGSLAIMKGRRKGTIVRLSIPFRKVRGHAIDTVTKKG